MAETDIRKAQLQSFACRILSTIGPRFGSAELAAGWYSGEPLAGFDGKTAMDLVEADRGDAVLRLIEAFDAGIHA